MSTLKVDAIRHNSATSDAITTAADGTCTAKLTSIGGGGLSHRNLIINGAMMVAKRGTSSTTSGDYAADRFRPQWSGTDENCTMAQVDVASGTTPYTSGFRKAIKITNGNQTSGAGAGDYVYIRYKAEAQDIANSGWNYTSTSSYITLSFWVKSSVAQNFYGRLETPDGTSQNYPFETGSLSADTWTKITKTIPGNSNLTFDNNNATGVEIFWQMFRGTDFTDNSVSNDTWAAYASGTRTKDATSTWYTTNDATFEITGVQLEVGDTATSFEHRSYADELQRCLRYFYQITKIGSTSEVTNKPIGVGMYYTASDYRCHIEFPVEMRAVPTFASNDNSNSFYIHYNANADFIDKMTGMNYTKKRATIRNNVNTSGTQGYVGFLNQETGDSNLSFSAEL